MPIHSLPDRGDPRVVAGLLAKEVLASLAKERDLQAESWFINFIRLLDTYRHNAFRSRKQRGVLERSDNAAKRPPSTDTMPRVRQALEAAHAEIFGEGTPRNDVVEFLIGVLEPCFRSGMELPTPGDLERTRQFVEALIRNLQAQP